ncbi:tetratricopeptide repeat protein [Caldalkalibacillus mannanilyticus]|uniref:tetratricopeptide repeat protein n=1 Tax=Caldalkalibacillus mannanilyticus TaxID=1418 RepID=UPI000467F2BE|nr:hypothetical protein [Caldalkalibacillus mannanilyticus]
MRIMKNTLWKGTSFTIPKSSSSKGCSLIAFIIMIWMLNSVPAHAFESLTIQNIEAMQRTDEGLKELIHRFEQDQERIKADRPDIYFYLKGLYSVVHNDFESAQEYYGKSKELSKITNHTDVEIAVLKRQIELSDFYGDSGELIDYGSRLLELAELNQDKITEMYAYDTIALAYYYLTNDEKANEYLEKLILLATKNKNEEYKAIYYTIMGHIYYSYQEYEKALKYYGPAMTAYQSVEQNSNMVFNMQFLAEGNILSTKAKFALEESEKAAILKEINVLIEKANDLYISKPTLYFLYVFKGQIEQDFHMIEEAIASYYFSREILETIQHIEKPYSYLNYVEMFLASAIMSMEIIKKRRIFS